MAQETAARCETVREVKFCQSMLGDVTLNGRFEGYASLFNRQDLGRDVVMPGAFRECLAKRAVRDIKTLFQHDPAQPIGIWDAIHEDGRGLFVRGRIMTEVASGREVLSLMRAGAIDGLSIGFRTVEARRDQHSRVRRLTKIDLWEISIVTFPMLPEARVATVKTRTGDAAPPTEREFERWLTREAGFTRSEARALMRDGIKGLKRRRDAGQGPDWEARLARRIVEAAQLLNEQQTESIAR
ncbi:MAG: hypothetical protein RLZ98_1962 [Pseudomonadota bacterium]|jgi:HK97 family phage prohead protease